MVLLAIKRMNYFSFSRRSNLFRVSAQWHLRLFFSCLTMQSRWFCKYRRIVCTIDTSRVSRLSMRTALIRFEIYNSRRPPTLFTHEQFLCITFSPEVQGLLQAEEAKRFTLWYRVKRISKYNSKETSTCNTYLRSRLPIVHSGPYRSDRTGNRRHPERTCTNRLRDRSSCRWHPRRSRILDNPRSHSRSPRCRKSSHDRWTKVRRDTDLLSGRIEAKWSQEKSNCKLKQRKTQTRKIKMYKYSKTLLKLNNKNRHK